MAQGSHAHPGTSHAHPGTYFTPARVLVLGFAGLITVGALLLTLPIASRTGTSLGLLDAYFTATSAVCVTGLVVVDTHDFFTPFGQVVILLLIESGALGFMTLSTILALVLGRRINLRERMLIQEAFNQYALAGAVDLVRKVVYLTLSIQAVGAFLLAWRFVPQFGWGRGGFYSLFHAVSTFANAGFDLMGGFRSLTAYEGDWLVSLTVAGLIIMGGLGFTVLLDLGRKRSFHRLALHSKMVLVVTGVLIVAGTVLILLFEMFNPETMAGLGWGQRVLGAFFQSVTARTAGFNTLPIGGMYNATLFITIILMFIGASPASTGGGVKTSTIGVLLATVYSTIKGRQEVVLFDRRLSADTTSRALTVVVVSFLLVTGATVLLTFSEPFTFIRVLFEAVSAFGTVGLSTGITPELSAAGRLFLILLMFAGRVGPVTLAVALATQERPVWIRYPEEKVIVG